MPRTYPEVDVSGRIEDDVTTLTDDTRSVIIGPTERGPVFIARAVGTAEQAERVYGSDRYQAAWAAREQAEAGGVPRVVRVAETGPYDPATVLVSLSDDDGGLSGGLYSGGAPQVGVLALVLTVTREDVSYAAVYGAWGDVRLSLFNASGAEIDGVSGSLDPGDPRYLPGVISGVEGVEVYVNFVETQVRLSGHTVRSVYRESGVVDLTEQPPTRARTPWVLSQHGDRLFRAHTLSEGANDLKISLSSIRPEGVFDVEVRDADDSDAGPRVLERFRDVSLDPDSPDYVARRIGDDVRLFDGERVVRSGGQFPSQSGLIRVEMAESATLRGDVYPWGNEGYRTPVAAPAGVTVPLLPTRDASVRGFYLGADVAQQQSQAFLNPTPDAGARQPDFSMPGGADTAPPDERRFTVAMQGGYTGGPPSTGPLFRADVTPQNQQGLDCSSFDAPGTQAYATAFRILRDPLSVDVRHVSAPGCLLSLHAPVLSQAQTLCEDRNDCLLTAQVAPPGATAEDVAEATEALTGSQVALFHGWADTERGDTPVGDAVPRLLIDNDSEGSAATAPAGVLTAPFRAPTELYTRAERERMLDAGVNVLTRESMRLRIAGNTTLGREGSALRGIGARRGTNFVKAEARAAALSLLFEESTEASTARFQAAVTGVLNNLTERGGIASFSVQVSREPPHGVSGEISISFQDVVTRVTVRFSVLRGAVVFE